MNLSIMQDHLLAVDHMSNSDDNDPSMDQAELSTADESQDDSLACSDLQNTCMSAAGDYDEIDFSLPLKQVLFSINHMVCQRLDLMESRIDFINNYCLDLGEKVGYIAQAIKAHNSQTQSEDKPIGHTVIVGVPQSHSTSSDDEHSGSTHRLSTTGSSIQLLTLNSEADFPNGSWMGNEQNPEMRVRCGITPTDLFHINTTCHTAEKMALTLLDYLFDRETQATSNISGTGKHKKKQLDPLMIYGIQCHLIAKFGIAEKDWNRIRQNMDSKCRTAYRRKMKGMPLIVKTVASPAVASSGSEIQSTLLQSTNLSDLGMDQSSNDAVSLDPSHILALHPGSLSLTCTSSDFASLVNRAQLIHTPQGDIQVLHATPEQLLEIQQTHQIQILSGDQVITANGIMQPVLAETLDSLQHVPDLEMKKE